MRVKKLIFLVVLVSFSLLWGIKMVKVPGATYTRGDDSEKSDLFPVHRVSVKSFYIGKYEVTQKQWNKLMKKASPLVVGDNYPVADVSWWDAVEFCNKLSRKEGLQPCYNPLKGKMVKCNYDASGYRLPSEAEWELAAIGGSDQFRQKYAGSSDMLEVGWVKDSVPHPVGQKKPNRLGIYDMTGNVFEWCNDWYDIYYYKLAAVQPDNPRGANYGSFRSIKGGCYLGGTTDATVFYRSFARPVRRKSSIGFRVVRSYK